MPKFPYDEIGTKIDRTFVAGLNKNFDEVEQDLRDVTEPLQAVLDGQFDDAALATEFEARAQAKLEEIEPQFYQFQQDTTAQFAQTKQEINDKFEQTDTFLQKNMEEIRRHTSELSNTAGSPFTFVDSGNYLFEPPASTNYQAGYTSVIQMDDKIANPIDKFYMYWAGHDGGGIRLSTAPTPLGPWTFYDNNDGPLLHDSVFYAGAFHISSPDIIWKADENKFFLFYHQAYEKDGIPRQSTWRVESLNGVEFYNPIEVIPCSLDNSFDGQERSYFRTIYSGGKWIGVYQGRNAATSADPHAHMCYVESEDLLNWNRLPHPLWYDNAFTNYADGWNIKTSIGGAPCLIEYKGVVWCFYTNGESNRKIYAAPLDLEARTVRPRLILGNTSWSAFDGTVNEPKGLESPNFLFYEDKLYMYFHDYDGTNLHRRVGVSVMDLKGEN